MTLPDESPGGLVLKGLDGSNPLAFLAALGTLRTLTLAWPNRQVKMAWAQFDGAWRPIIQIAHSPNEDAMVEALDDSLKSKQHHLAFQLGDNLNVAPEIFHEHAQKCMEFAHQHTADDGRRFAADFAAAFACDLLTTENKDEKTVHDTALRTMSGAGHQHFLKFMRNIIEKAEIKHLRNALFTQWKYDDPVASMTLRWDPLDDSRYALQWKNPSGDPSRKQRGGMLGANRLAIEGLPLFACAPIGRHLHTTGFTGRGKDDTFWTWPIWSRPISLDCCRSILAYPALLTNDPKQHAKLPGMGIPTAFRCQRITEGKFRNFTPATAVF